MYITYFIITGGTLFAGRLPLALYKSAVRNKVSNFRESMYIMNLIENHKGKYLTNTRNGSLAGVMK